MKAAKSPWLWTFSETYSCHFQDEVPSGFFDKTLVVIHPMMAYYRQKIDGREVPVKRTITGVTDDDTKDATLVKTFKDMAIKIILQASSNPVHEVHEFTDCCASQYKGKHSFLDISERSHPKVVRNYFETSHGKSVCDQLGAIVKQSCYKAVVSGTTIIENARDLFNFRTSKVTVSKTFKPGDLSLSKHKFVFVDRITKREKTDVNTVGGTRKLHAVKQEKRHMINVKSLSCCCRCHCGQVCSNIEFVSSWECRDVGFVSATQSTLNHISILQLIHYSTYLWSQD